MEELFRSLGSISVLFKENMTEAREIMTAIQEIKKNSEVIA